jgi:methionine-rich copper-binding protein CopC
MTTPFVRLLAGFGMIAVILASGASSVSAHATLERCTIASNAVLAAAPRQVACTFAEGVNPRGSFVHVFSATSDKAQVDLDNSQVPFTNAKQIVLGLPKLAPGAYTLLWYTVSADDGHKAGGAFNFSIK